MAINRDKVLASAVKLLQSGKFEKAIAEFRRLIDDDPKDVRTILKVGDAYVKMGRRAEAIEAYERVAKIYSEQGFYLKAVAVFKQMLRVDPNLPDVHLQLAEMYQQLGLSSDALQHFQQVAVFYERQGSTGDSLNILKRMVDLDPDNLPSRIKLAELFAQQGMNQEAIAEFRSAADYLIAQDRHEDYVRVGERLIYFDPRALDVTRQLAEIYLKRGDAKLALGKLQLCFKAQPRDLEILELIATAFQEMQQVGKTVSVFKEIARIHETDGNAEEAGRNWRRVLDVDPGDAEANQALGSSPAAAPAPAAAAPAPAPAPAAPADPDAEELARLLTETDVYLKYKLYDKAIVHVRKALSLRPDLIEAHDKLRAVYQGMGDRDGLIAQLRVLIQRGEASGDPRLDEWRHDLEALSNAPPPPVAQPPPAEEISSDFSDMSDDMIIVETEALVIEDESIAEIAEMADFAGDVDLGGASNDPFSADLGTIDLDEASIDILPQADDVIVGMEAIDGEPLHGEPDEPILGTPQLSTPAVMDLDALPPDELDATADAVDDVSFVDQAAVDDALAESRALEAQMRADSGDESFDGISSAEALPLDAADEVVRALEGASDDDILAGFSTSIADAPAVTELGGPDLDIPSDDMAEAFQKAANEALSTGAPDDEFAEEATELMELSLEEMDEIRGLISQATAMRGDEGAEEAFEEGSVGELPSAADLMKVNSDELDLHSLAEAAANEIGTVDANAEFGGNTDEVSPPHTSPEASTELATEVGGSASFDELLRDAEEQAAAFEGGIGFPPPLQDYEPTGEVSPDMVDDFQAKLGSAPEPSDDDHTLPVDPEDLAEALPELLAGAAELETHAAPAEFGEEALIGSTELGVEVPDLGAPSEDTGRQPAPIPELLSPAGPSGPRGSLGVSEEAYGFENDPAASFFPDELEEAEFFIQTDLLDEAKEILEEILEDVPDSLRAQWMMARIVAKENDEPEPLAPWKQKIIDEVEEELDPPELGSAPIDPSQVSVEEVLSQFKKGVAEQVSEDDADTHYNLGIAYKEMGLHSDSIQEFRLAARAPTRRVDALLLIAGVQRDAGDVDEALATIEEALGDPAIGDKERGVAAYERGVCLEATDRFEEARAAYEKARDLGGDMGDLSDRIAKLANPGAGVGAPADDSGRRKNIDYV